MTRYGLSNVRETNFNETRAMIQAKREKKSHRFGGPGPYINLDDYGPGDPRERSHAHVRLKIWPVVTL